MLFFHHPIWLGIINFPVCFDHKRNSKLSYTGSGGWRKQEWPPGTDLLHVVLLPPKTGNTELDIKGAASWASGFAVRSSSMVQNRSILPKCL